MFPSMFHVLVDQMMPASVAGAFTVDKYLSLLLTMTVAFGIVFEMPLAVAILAMVAWSRPPRCARCASTRSSGSFIFAGVVTPTTDPLSLFMMAIPLCVFYEIGIIFASIVYKKRQEKKRLEGLESGVSEPG